MALSQDLWKILTAIRNRIDVSEFKNYVMPLCSIGQLIKRLNYL